MRSSTNKQYNIILVYGFFRVHNHYLNIVKYLSPDFRIGIYLADAAKRGGSSGTNQMLKVKDTDDLFLETLKSYGADILEEGSYECSLLVFPQVNFNLEFVKETGGRIKRKKAIALQTFGYGMQMLREFAELGINTFFIYDKRIFDNKLHSPEDRSFVENNYEIVEMGAPYKKYPVFDNIEIDYLIAYPTAMLIKDPHHRNKLLENILGLIKASDPDDKIVLKLHNVRDNGNRLFNSYRFGRGGRRLQAIAAEGFRVLSKSSRKLLGDNKISNKLVAFSSNILHSGIEDKVLYMSDMTPYYNFGLELFLPFVKKGMVTGISSSTWYALYNKLPVYNCDDQPFTEDGIINSDTYKSFYVPPCRGKLEFDPESFNMVPESSRQADLIELIKQYT